MTAVSPVAEDVSQRPDVARRMFQIAGRYALINVLIAIPLHLLIDAAGFGGTTATWKHGVVVLAVAGVVFAPIMETFMHFWLPIVVVRKVLGQRSGTPFVAWLACVGPFAYGHYGGDFGRSALTALCTGLVSGSCFYFCFLTAEKNVGISPFWTTALCHALFNGTVLVVFGLAYVLGFLS
ncbi:hypothetical protein [Gluconobacter oxydans]|uniref:Uncharacterized protein n=2 Tax=Gluconobacter oxydans TaxID=442 RepID=A0A067Z3S6_GLUOY|nr:hypothetical protein [Gluconobacter oxydans]AHK70884.1 hypothetical protein GLS_c09760 [Gluconobacter oxydans DSM 3504]